MYKTFYKHAHKLLNVKHYNYVIVRQNKIFLRHLI